MVFYFDLFTHQITGILRNQMFGITYPTITSLDGYLTRIINWGYILGSIGQVGRYIGT
jgi:hypothetical protein